MVKNIFLLCDLINHPEISQVILSGGDPMVLKDKSLAHLISELERLPQLSYLRFHTRLPIMIPDRVTDDLVMPLSRTRLKTTNDDAETLAALSYQLYRYGVITYYLYLLDPVQGTAHFDVSEAKEREIARQLQANLPGYLVPRFVKEVAGEKRKSWIGV